MFIKKYYDFFEFRDEFCYLLNDDFEACNIMHDHIEEESGEDADGAMFTDAEVRDLFRQVLILTEDEVFEQYDQAREYDSVEEFLNDNTFIYGTYEMDDDTIVYVVDEF